MSAAWYVYLVECADGTLYCGITTDPERRVAEHNGLLPGGAKYTRSRQPVRLAACVSSADRSSASRLEIRIQKTMRSRKLALLLASGESF